MNKRILVTGGAGYIGCVLVPHLLDLGHTVEVLDNLTFGDDALRSATGERAMIHRIDVRDTAEVDAVLERGFDAVIQLAAVSNDPSSDLEPEITQAINGDATWHLMRAARAAGVRRFLYASSASVYGIQERPDVHEGVETAPITIYAKLKLAGEEVLNGLVDESFVGVSVRAATVCGMSPRLRLDLTVNILTHAAVERGRITVFGGSQMRPNIHIRDLVDFYTLLLDADPKVVNGRAFNVSARNMSVREIAEDVRAALSESAEIEVTPTDDLRSYRLDASRADRELGFRPRRSVRDAIDELAAAFRRDEVPDSGSDWYRNVRWLQANPELLLPLSARR